MDGGGSVRKTRGRPRKYGPILDPNTSTKEEGKASEATACGCWYFNNYILLGVFV